MKDLLGRNDDAIVPASLDRPDLIEGGASWKGGGAERRTPPLEETDPTHWLESRFLFTLKELRCYYSIRDLTHLSKVRSAIDIRDPGQPVIGLTIFKQFLSRN
jgi:hypothetical protein